jgi:hypothetical protein
MRRPSPSESARVADRDPLMQDALIQSRVNTDKVGKTCCPQHMPGKCGNAAERQDTDAMLGYAKKTMQPFSTMCSPPASVFLEIRIPLTHSDVTPSVAQDTRRKLATLNMWKVTREIPAHLPVETEKQSTIFWRQCGQRGTALAATSHEGHQLCWSKSA